MQNLYKGDAIPLDPLQRYHLQSATSTSSKSR